MKALNTVKKIILDYCRITIREDIDNVGISFGLRQAIFTNVFDLKYAAAKIIFHQQPIKILKQGTK